MSMDISSVVDLYVQVIQLALPFTLVFYFCDFIVGTFLRVAFGGHLTFRSF